MVLTQRTFAFSLGFILLNHRGSSMNLRFLSIYSQGLNKRIPIKKLVKYKIRVNPHYYTQKQKTNQIKKKE